MIKFSFGDCFVSTSTTVTEPPKLLGNFLKDCENNTTSITVKANNTGLNYSWNTNPVQTGTDLSTISITVVQDTTYYVATVTDAVGCSSKDSVRVIGIPQPGLTLADSNSCEGKTIVLHGKPGNIMNLDSLYPSYAWYKNNVTMGISRDSISVNNSGLYKEVMTIGNCVAKDSANLVFNVNPAGVLPDYVRFCRDTDNKTVLDAGPGAGYKYQWLAPAGITLDSNDKEQATIRFEGHYSVIVTNTFKCSTKDSVFVDDLCGPRVFVPNAFTPDKPGGDKIFKVFGEYFTNYKMMIFNRWGEMIFISSDRNDGWDGTFRGEPVPIGVYTWVVTYEGEIPEMKGPYKQEGSVTLIR
jgi:gliding motility-associated-like protein